MFDYYYREEAEQFSFIRIPKQLFTDPEFSDLSTDAKLVYGLLLDRMSLSRKNDWFDEDNRVFIVFSIEDIANTLNYSKNKSVKILQELDTEIGVGLIEKKRLGLGKPNIIYVKNFIKSENIVGEISKNSLEMLKSSRIPKNQIQEYQNIKFKNTKKSNSRIPKYQIQEYQKMVSNNTNINKTDYNKTNNMGDDDEEETKNLQQFIDCWNGLPDEINKILACNQSRIDNINNLINKFGIELVCKAINSISVTDFLLGKKTTWKINIDWFCDEDNFVKVLEGYYQDQTKSKNDCSRNTKSITDIARARRLKRLAESTNN
ncbi:replication initiator protein A domain protein [Anaerococcus lactolyticus ATCC 51172]|uniref:Replication initiator protein A domain protein n=1 Tax=Anaerococcus lactolyticus ATCC 51172 TaxID=525254 RepID=C2BD56_9FIRM|nr:replication initiator protein A [Anaerococcus lactolyticus]EEI87248.1 replication initiator protein A domain protein [Anaerococcus lactolyticus ATCC 51172]